MNMELDVFYPPAAPGLLATARAAALKVFVAADVDPYDAWLAWAEELRWMECGCDDAYRPSADARRLMDLHARAQAAANDVLGLEACDVITLDFVER